MTHQTPLDRDIVGRTPACNFIECDIQLKVRGCTQPIDERQRPIPGAQVQVIAKIVAQAINNLRHRRKRAALPACLAMDTDAE